MDGLTQSGNGDPCDPREVTRPAAANDQSGLFDAASIAPADRIGRLLSTLEVEIIPRLIDLHAERGDARQGDVQFAPAEIEWLAGAAIADDAGPAQQRIDSLSAAGVPPESLALHLLAPAACLLGRWWDDDRCTFADVTVGVGRLQRWMRQAMPAVDPAWARAPLGGRRVLLAAAPGEQHTFGLSIVGEMFVQAGWDVTISVGGEGGHPVDAAGSQWFDAVGFSVGSHTRLDWLSSMISAVRHASRNPSVAVLVGGPIFGVHPEYADQIDADAACCDGRQAPVVADALLLRRVRSA